MIADYHFSEGFAQPESRESSDMRGVAIGVAQALNTGAAAARGATAAVVEDMVGHRGEGYHHHAISVDL